MYIDKLIRASLVTYVIMRGGMMARAGSAQLSAPHQHAARGLAAGSCPWLRRNNSRAGDRPA